MKITIRSGGRGRPLSVDPDVLISQFSKQIGRAKTKLSDIREMSSGVRNAQIFGTKTSLPQWVIATADVLEALRQGEDINIETARELKSNIRTISQLASKQERVYSKALSESLVKEYEQALNVQMKQASEISKRIYNKMKQNIRQMTKQQQQAFLTSRSYQDPRTNTVNDSVEFSKNRKRIEDWVKNEGDLELKGEDALAYIEYDRQIFEQTGLHIKEHPKRDEILYEIETGKFIK